MSRPRKIDDITRARVISMARDGVRPALIDRALPHVGLANIYKAISSARKAGDDIPSFPAARMPYDGTLPRFLSIEVAGMANRQDLLDAAKRRGITENNLVSRLLSVVLLDGMIDAILDDGVSRNAA